MVPANLTSPWFSSSRERRLWLWTLAVVVAIYSTLGLARTLAGELRNRELLDASFAVGMLVIGVAVAVLALRMQPAGIEIGIALGIAAVYLMLLLRMAIPEERTHVIEYSVVAVFILEALRERVSRGRRVPAPAVLAVALAGLIGVVDESIQAVLPSRVFDPVDMLFNVLAATVAVVAATLLTWARRQRRPVPPAP